MERTFSAPDSRRLTVAVGGCEIVNAVSWPQCGGRIALFTGPGSSGRVGLGRYNHLVKFVVRENLP